MAEKTEFENSWSNLKNGENGNFTIVKFHFSIKLSKYKGSLQKKEKSFTFVKPAGGWVRGGFVTNQKKIRL